MKIFMSCTDLDTCGEVLVLNMGDDDFETIGTCIICGSTALYTKDPIESINEDHIDQTILELIKILHIDPSIIFEENNNE